MIKFFRHIRKDLMEKNPPGGRAGKTGKPALPAGRYFKYAIGEIVLVVIGILIALSINNWNQKIKRQELRQSYLRSLIVDLVQDTIDIKNVVRNQINDSLKVSILRKELTKEDATLDDLVRITIYEWDPRIGGLRGFNTQTFDALVSTGNIDLIDPDILKSLGKINSLQEGYLSFIGEFIDFYRKSGDPAINIASSISVIDQGPIFDKLIEETDKVQLANNFNVKLTLKRQTNRVSIRLLNTIQHEKIKLIDLINEKVE